MIIVVIKGNKKKVIVCETEEEYFEEIRYHQFNGYEVIKL